MRRFIQDPGIDSPYQFNDSLILNHTWLVCRYSFVFPRMLTASVPESERIPVDIRRTTFVVRDIDKSLPLYRDALGLKIVYDQLIVDGVDPDGKPVVVSERLVLLRANHLFIGALGLLQRLNQPPPPPPEFKKAAPGQMILVINVADLEDRWPIIESTAHVKVETPPTLVDYPATDGGRIAVLYSAVWDADGNYIEINRVLGSPAGSTVSSE